MPSHLEPIVKADSKRDAHTRDGRPRTARSAPPPTRDPHTSSSRRRGLSYLLRLAFATTLAPLAAIACSATAALAAAPAVLDPSPCCAATPVAAYGGWSGWSRSDEATHQFQLVVRSPQGTIVTPAVPERGAPFDLQIGPTAAGPVAVFSRCADARTLQGCALHELSLGSTFTESALQPPLGGSLHEPAIWQGRLAFLRRRSGSEDPLQPARRPDDLYVWDRGSGHARAQQLASSKGARGAVSWPRGLTGVISGLTLDSRWLAYVTDTASGTFALSTLWAQRLGQGPRLVDQVTGGAGNVCPPQLLSPALAGERLDAYLHACSTSNADLDRWTRYSLTSHSAERASYHFTSGSDDEIFGVVPAGSGAIWSDGAILSIGSVAFTPIHRSVPQSFCGHNDLIC